MKKSLFGPFRPSATLSLWLIFKPSGQNNWPIKWCTDNREVKAFEKRNECKNNTRLTAVHVNAKKSHLICFKAARTVGELSAVVQ